MNDSIMNQPATKRDLENLRLELTGQLSSKEEIKKLATKEELKKLATKEELKNEIRKLATKEDLKKLVTKKEFAKQQKSFDKLTSIVFDNQRRLDLLETKEDANKKFNLLVGMIDGLTKKVELIITEMKATNHALNRHENRLENHEDRIDTLEQRAVGH